MNRILALITLVLVCQSTLKELPKIIWTYWEAQIPIDSTLYLFHLNHLYYSEGWQVILLNDKTILSYLQKIADAQMISKIIDSQITIKKTYMKILLLKHYGGVWIEYLALMTQKMNWIQFNRLLENKNIVRPHVQQIECIIFSFFEKNDKDQSQFQINFDFDGFYQNFQDYRLEFLACKPNSLLVNDMEKIYIGSFLQKIPQNNIKIHSILYNKLSEIKLEVDHTFYDKDSVKLEISSTYLNTYNVLTLNAQDGPLGIFSAVSDYQVYYAIRFVLYFTQRIGKGNRYFLKFCVKDFQILRNFLQTPLLGLSFDEIIITLNEERSFQNFNHLFCPQRFQIHRGSIIFNHLLKNSKKSIIWSNTSKDTLEPFDSKCMQMKRFFKTLKEKIIALDKKLSQQEKQFLEQIFISTESSIDAQNKDKKEREQNLKLISKINHQIDNIEKQQRQIIQKLVQLENKTSELLNNLQRFKNKKLFLGLCLICGLIVLVLVIFTFYKKKRIQKIVGVPSEQQNTSQQENQIQ